MLTLHLLRKNEDSMLRIKETIDTDVLIVGGGIGGMMAAIAAAEQGAKVLVAEKSNTRRSGSGATGNDHFCCYIPELHGDDMEVIVQEVLDSLVGLCQDVALTRTFLKESFSVAKLWHSYGINMQPSGEWCCMGHAYPDRPRIWLKYDGHNQKPVLTAEARKRGVKIINHHPVTDLVTQDGRVCGALALNVADPEASFTLIRAGAVVLATGTANRLYSPAGTPASLFNTAFCPACAGAAQAQAWRVGGTLVNMELPNRHAGPKFFARCGKSTWIGVYKYPDGSPLGPFVTNPTRELGDITADVWNTAFSDVVRNGSGPSYIDCSEISDDDRAFMLAGMRSEGLTSLIAHMERDGVDTARHAVEFTPYEPHLIGRGLEIDANGATNIAGLYATGDMVGNFRADIAGAAVFGWIGGRHAGHNVLSGREFSPEAEARVQERMEFYNGLYGEERHAAPWQEANKALQQIMNDYAAAGPYRVRSETLLRAGLKYLGDLRGKTLREVRAANAHELMRTLETVDLLDCAEVIMHAARERKESRGMHRRSDYTFTNPLLTDQFLTLRRQDGRIVTQWRKKWK